jgi:hypothetical protein
MFWAEILRTFGIRTAARRADSQRCLTLLKIIFIINSGCALQHPATAELIRDTTVRIGAVIAVTP